MYINLLYYKPACFLSILDEASRFQMLTFSGLEPSELWIVCNLCYLSPEPPSTQHTWTSSPFLFAGKHQKPIKTFIFVTPCSPTTSNVRMSEKIDSTLALSANITQHTSNAGLVVIAASSRDLKVSCTNMQTNEICIEFISPSPPFILHS